jgi:integrase
MPKTPSYRKRRGYTQALVTLTDAATKRRKDYWLGEYGTTASRELYHRVIAAWEANGRRLPRLDPERPGGNGSDLRIKEIIHEYSRWAKVHYRNKHVQSLRGALRLIRKYYGQTSALDFGPNKLRLLRDEMIRGDANDDPPRKPWSRKYINQQVQRVRRIFKWAVAHEFVPASVHQALCTLEPLKRGRTAAREHPKVGPVPDDLLDATLPHTTRPVRALVELQLYSGARAGELLELRACDIEMDCESGVWTYRPDRHKNTHRERDRLIYFGPRAQEVLRPFLTNRPTAAYLFSPAEAEAERRAAIHAERKTPLSCGNRPGTNRRSDPKRKPGDRYTTPSYYRAIQYACDRAFPPPARLARGDDETTAEWQARLTPKQKAQLSAWRKAHRWHPHQLRHNAATLLRRQFGLEAAQLALGHASAQITGAVYAERDREKVIDIMLRIG